ncbi:MAG: peptidylprolyl isomerase [Oscillospiraceae bacterium]|nr:peptidylprolyl isomerase [Oscillospiraceae bacterium]
MNTAKKGICLILALLLCIGLFAACGNTVPEPPPTPEAPPEASPTVQPTLDPGPIYLAGIDARTVVLEIEGRPVYWEEFFFDLHSVRAALVAGGSIEDWDAVFEGQMQFDGEVTYNEFAILHAIDAAMERRVVEIFYTEELGESLEEDAYEVYRPIFLAHHGFTEEAFAAFLESNFLTESVFRYITEIMFMHEGAAPALYGEDGAGVPREAVDALVEEEGILRAKHILISADGPDDAAATARAREIYQELRNFTGTQADFLAQFDALMGLHGEDPGMLTNPNGYTFLPGVMVEEFTDGTTALDYYEISAPIRSFFGYHIILRLPVQPEASVMLPGGGQSAPIQIIVARIQLEQLLEQLREELTYERMPVLATIVPSEIFAYPS